MTSATSEPARRTVGSSATAKRRLIADRVARWMVTAGGMAVIAAILGILVFIVIEVWPLMRGADVTPAAETSFPNLHACAVLTDEYRTHIATLSRDGSLRVFRTEDWSMVVATTVIEGRVTTVAAVPGQQSFAAATDDGRVVAVPVEWEISFVGQDRVVTPVIGDSVVFELDPERGSILAFSARLDEDGAGAAAAVLENGSLVLVRREVETNLFTGEVDESFERHAMSAPSEIGLLLLDRDRVNLYGATARGEILWWSLANGVGAAPSVASLEGARPTALSLLIGDRSLLVGGSDGTLSVWFPVRRQNERFALTRIRDFPSRAGSITLLAPSLRNKSFLAQDETGMLGLYYSTSSRVLWTGRSPVGDATALFLTPKSDGMVVAGPDRIVSLDVHNPHPEVSFRALFGKVWYEDHEKPEYVWQSSGGTDDFESKLSLTPLMVGTLKGTVYSLLLAIPLGVLGAMFTSQFMHPSYKRVVKPMVEIMAALPSVVLGFLAGLWLAPRIERLMPALMLMLVILPATVVVTGFAWRALPPGARGRFRMGFEIWLYMSALLIGTWISIELAPGWETVAFGGDFQAWLLQTTGLRYDQRNAIVVGVAMGFAVIPIIFSIAEDAFSNVPRNLVAGSLALGASRWQTVTRVVLPTASPGILSGIIVGFGRAIGETMIVLMATGNTPVLDWGPFNGFRTLSANIAVEIPEAPHGETLYRTLFLAALMLFAITFVINTFAELIRQRLRRRYSEL